MIAKLSQYNKHSKNYRISAIFLFLYKGDFEYICRGLMSKLANKRDEKIHPKDI